MTNFIYPCCRVYIWFGDYGYAYLDHDFNYVDWFFELELNAGSSFIALLCYSTIYIYIIRANRKIAGNVQQDVIAKRRSKE
uniref:Uncharacterized protein n=1 Tax=Acrobeloides nanus TaxID=290746 RepID=A0A914D9W0_9BILA